MILTGTLYLMRFQTMRHLYRFFLSARAKYWEESILSYRGLDEDGSDIIVNSIKQYYSGTPYLPREILSGREIQEDDKMELETWLSAMRGGKVEIINPKKGAKEALVTLAEKMRLWY